MASPLDPYLQYGSAEQKALYGRKANDQTLSEFLRAENPVQYLTGEYQVGAQNQGAADALSKMFGDYSQSLYDQQKKSLATKGINLDAYLDPSYQLYNVGEGAGANRGANVTKTYLLAKAQQDAIKLALGGGNAPDYKAQLQQKYAQADALAKSAFRDPALRAQADRIMNLINGYNVNQNIDPSVLAAENASAARVAANLPNAGAGIGAIMPGGPIDNSNFGNGTNYSQIQQQAQQGGTPIGTNAGTAPVAKTSAQVTPGNITFDPSIGDNGLGSYVFNGRAYSTLAAAQKAATNSGVTPVYNAPTTSVSQTPTMPVRSSYAAGAAGDYQYQMALDRYHAAQSGTQWKTPTNTTPAITAPIEATDTSTAADLINKLAASMLTEQGSASTPPGTASGKDDVTSLINSLLYGNSGSTTGTTGANGTTANGVATNANGAPTFNAAVELQKLQSQLGTDELQQQIAGIDAQIKLIQGTQFNNQQFEENKAVSLGVMSGRISEEARQANEKLTPLIAQKTLLTEQYNSKLNTIQTLMQAKQTDFQNAYNDYNNQFDRATKLASLLEGLNNDQRSAADAAQANARANATIITNALSSGGIDYASLDDATKANFAKLELQAGLPAGTIAAFQQKPGSQWSMATSVQGTDENGNLVSTVVQQNKMTGELKTTKIATDSAPKPTGSSGQKGTYVDDKGNQVAWQIVNGKLTSTVVGKTSAKTDPAQNAYDKLRMSVAQTLSKTDTWGQPVPSARDAAIRLIKAQYPGVSDADVQTFLSSF